MVIRNKTNLTGLANPHLRAIAETCVAAGVDEAELMSSIAGCQMGRVRVEVKAAACAYDLLEAMWTIRHSQAPTEETALWSSLEGGHTYFEVPAFDIDALIDGQVVVSKR